jgi:hypothetical protein
MDGPAVLVGFAARLLRHDRPDWGQAMVGELEQHQGLARWRFAWGCAVAAMSLPHQRGSGRRIVIGVLAAAMACMGLLGYGIMRYPAIITGPRTWMAMATFAVTLAGFVIAANMAARHSSVGVAGLVAGCVTAGIWIAVGATIVLGHSKAAPFLLLILPLVSVAVGMIGARYAHSRTAGRRIAIISAIVSALTIFLVLAAETLATGGRPYDAGQLRDFAASGYPDIATYAVNDNLGTAMMLLLLVSAMTALLGSAGATIAIRRNR